MFVHSSFFFISFYVGAVQSMPAIRPPSTTAIDFMRKFGYLEALGSAAETLYKEETIVEAIKTMQKFGGLPETGIIDNSTTALFSTPRCGVPDVNQPPNNRTKRYIIGSEGWKKRHITYFIANWSPKLGDRQNTESQLKRAFDLWSDYSGLKFSHTQNPDADIVIFFARGSHGDGYPLDGPGFVLAHAFYPYEHGSFGGDIHFDDEEDWVIGSEEGFDLYTVAAHEIGHSLGLSHSPVFNSLMFPYYKAHAEDAFLLDYDDILAVYQLYVSKPAFEDDAIDQGRKNSEEEKSEEFDTSDDVDSNESEEDSEENVEPDETDSVDDDGTNAGVDVDVVDTNDTTPSPIPDLCDGSYDTVTNLRNELFVFKDRWVWRFRERGVLENGYPTTFQQIFQFPVDVPRLDAIYERPHDNNILLFSGRTYWIFDGDRLVAKKPLPLTALSLPSDVEKLDAALVWGKNDKVYLFRRENYWRFNDSLNKMDEGYPQNIGRWRGLPTQIDSAFQWTDGLTYFFVGKEYYRFNDQAVIVDEQYPLSALEYWFGC